MVRREITTLVCDMCTPKSGKTAEVVFSDMVGLGDFRRHLDLCKKHSRQVIGNLREVMAEYGARPVIKGALPVQHRRPDPAFACPLCPEGPFVNAQGLAAHKRIRHGVSKATQARELSAS